jgi:hypothetical protein
VLGCTTRRCSVGGWSSTTVVLLLDGQEFYPWIPPEPYINRRPVEPD